MIKLHVAAIAAAIVCGLTLAQGASAQTAPARLSQVVPISGAAKNGSKFTGKYTIERFVARGGKLYSVGTLKGKLRGKRVTKENVRLPATVGDASARASQLPLPPPPPPPPPPSPPRRCRPAMRARSCRSTSARST